MKKKKYLLPFFFVALSVHAATIFPPQAGGSATNAIGKTNGTGFGTTTVDKLVATNITGGVFTGNGAGLTNLSGTNSIQAAAGTSQYVTMTNFQGTNGVIDYVLGHVNRGMYLYFSDQPGDSAYSQIYLDPIHNTGTPPGAPGNFEWQHIIYHNYALAPGYGTGDGYFQFGGNWCDDLHASSMQFFNASKLIPDGGTNTLGYTLGLVFQVKGASGGSWGNDGAGTEQTYSPGIFGRYLDTNQPGSYQLAFVPEMNTNPGNFISHPTTWKAHGASATVDYSQSFQLNWGGSIPGGVFNTNLNVLGNLSLGHEGGNGTIHFYDSLNIFSFGLNGTRGIDVYVQNGAGGDAALFGGAQGYNKLGVPTQFPTNALSTWPTAPVAGGASCIVNSNGSIFILSSLPKTLAWSKTNFICHPF